ncbi:hypothetical protein [Streptomyces sp. NPDC052701]|uniref:hypothetical protein n=1 Tax=Streptomyces sp. NPDC052701 TaxID=3155533 RepID=UPI00343AAAA6
MLASGTPYDVCKLARPGLEVWEPVDAELRVAQAVLDAVPDGLGEPLYARVGLLGGEDGEARLMGLELVESNLFLSLRTGRWRGWRRRCCGRRGSGQRSGDGRSRGGCGSGRWVTSSGS